MRRLWLHIGSHKTGTSTLQRNLRRAKNAGQFGPYRYLHFKGHFQANPIVRIEGQGADMQALVQHDLVEQLIPPDGDGVLSTEMLFWLSDQAPVTALAQQLRAHFDEIKVVAYLRRQDALALSHRKQVVMGVAALQFYGCQISALPTYQPHMQRYFDYAAKLALWEEAFGADALVVRRFEPAHLVGGDTVNDFFTLIGAPFEKRVDDVNQALSRSAALAGLWLRQQPTDYPRQAFEPLLYAIEDSDRLMPSRADAEAFHARFAASNEALVRRYDPDGPTTFFNADFSRYPEQGNDSLTDLKVDLAELEAKVKAQL